MFAEFSVRINDLKKTKGFEEIYKQATAGRKSVRKSVRNHPADIKRQK